MFYCMFYFTCDRSFIESARALDTGTGVHGPRKNNRPTWVGTRRHCIESLKRGY